LDRGLRIRITQRTEHSMSKKKNYTTHRATITLLFDVSKGGDPDESADQIVRDMIGDGYPVVLDDVERLKVGHPLIRPSFVKTALEAGHGDDFKACFVFTRSDMDDVYICESVDLLIRKFGGEVWFGIGAVGGEVEITEVRNSDGSLNTEQMCRDWLGVWHRHFVGAVEDSVQGMYLMIKQVVSEGKFTK